MRQLIIDSGFIELRTGKGAFVIHNVDGSLGGMMVLHVDDSCFGGEGETFDKAIKSLLEHLTIGQEDSWEAGDS